MKYPILVRLLVFLLAVSPFAAQSALPGGTQAYYEYKAYYRTIRKVEDHYEVTDYYDVNDSIMMKALCSDVEPNLVFDGPVTYFYENGQVKETGTYQQGHPVGLFTYGYENGQRQKEVLYTPQGLQVCQYWLEDGTPLLKNGTGVIDRPDPDLPYAPYKEVEDSMIVTSYYIRPAQGDTIFLESKERATYVGGVEKLYSDLGEHFGGYPSEARALKIEGTVVIKFIVDKQGVALEASILQGIGYGCDEAALKAFAQLGTWNPAFFHGKPVKTQMVIPVVFALD